MNTLLALAGFFSGLSLLAVGGGDATLPTIEAQALSSGWVTQSQFLGIYSLGQLAPGPATLYVAGIGYVAAGIPGAVVAGLSYTVPPAVLVMVLSRLWSGWSNKHARNAIRIGLVPVTVGLLINAVHSLLETLATNASTLPQPTVVVWLLIAVAVTAVAWLAIARKVNPAWLVLGSAGVFLVVLHLPW
ncbi:MAG: chromate transporter [Actinomycetes bacterium]